MTSLSRVPLLILLPLAIFLSMAGPGRGADETMDRPNFVLFIADDVSAVDFGCYGHPTIRTPHIDALAADGLRFRNAYLTTSSCSPTRTSIITGRYPHNTGGPELHMRKQPHLAELAQFPELLREAGYHTAQAGKWHFNGDASASFDVRKRGYPSGSEHWLPVLRERPKDKPFFCWFAAVDAHREWDMALEDGPHGPEDMVVPPYMVDTPATRKDLAHYADEVHRFDASIGKVVAELKAQGVYENTVLMVIVDNGSPFPRDKTWLYDSGIKTPLVLHWPRGVAEAAEPASLVSVIDIAPTFLELARVPVPETFQGVSLRPMIEDPQAKVRDFVFAERNWHTQRYHERMVRRGNFVYIRNHLPELTGINIVHASRDQPAYNELVRQYRAGETNEAQDNVMRKTRPVHELYDVSSDPVQLVNLAGDAAHADTLAKLQGVLDQWMEETGDTVPERDEMTPDRNDRETWEPVRGRGGRPGGGVVPGESTEAWTIHRPGPVLDADVEDGE